MPGPPLRVLHIDDDEADRAFVAHLLTGQGFEVYGVPGIEEIPGSGQYSLVLLDLGLGKHSGIQSLLAAQAAVPGAAPIVVFTGARDEHLHDQALQFGARGWLYKSELRRETAAAVSQRLRQLVGELDASTADTEDSQATGDPQRIRHLDPKKYGLVLLVEDDPRVADVLERHMLGQGLVVEFVGDLASAVLRVQDTEQLPVGLVHLDLTLSDAAGLHAPRTLSRLAPDVFLTVFTGDPSPGLREEGLALGARRWFTKPTVPELLAVAAREDLLYRYGLQARLAARLPTMQATLAQATATGTVLIEEIEVLPRTVAAVVTTNLQQELPGKVAGVVVQAMAAQFPLLAQPTEGAEWQRWLRKHLGEWITPKLVDRFLSAVGGAILAIVTTALALWKAGLLTGDVPP